MNGLLVLNKPAGMSSHRAMQIVRRLFRAHVGASPLSVAQTQRLHFAKRLIDQTGLPLRDVAFASGYRSVRRFNDEFQKTYQRSPRELRKKHRQRDDSRPGGEVHTQRDDLAGRS